MKKIYESPVMMAEAYETNAYCAGCGDYFPDGTITTLPSKAKNSSTDRNGWQGSLGFDEDDLTHTFSNMVHEISSGVCGPNGRKTCEDTSQKIWKCICTNHPGETWYLEWSHYYSTHDGNKDAFFLYKEATGDQKFNITANSSSWPAKEANSDYNVAMIEFKNNESPIVAS